MSRALLSSFLLVAACSGGTPVTDAGITPDSSTTPGPQDVPAVLLVSDPATACPGDYATSAPPAGLNSGFIASGQNREFFLILPPDTFEGPRPLFIAFNGTGETGPSFSSRADLEDFAARGFIVLAPSSNMNGSVWPIWDDMRQSTDHTRANPDVDYVDQLLGCVAGHYEIDSNRIYVGGHSAGGIFTNAFIQRRSELVAGAIAASGIIDLTSPAGGGDLDSMFVIVTWGGDNDIYSGGVDITVPEFNFAEQAALSTQFYDAQPNVTQVNCHPPVGVGHAWLPLNDWFIDRLLEHPKGMPGADITLPPPSDARYTCQTIPVPIEGGVQITCPASTVNPECQTQCQYIADCAAENSTVQPVIAEQLMMLGFSGASFRDCGGCISKCEADATTAADAEVFGCVDAQVGTMMCGPGIEGFQPYANAIDGCCSGRTDSPYCVETCRIFLTNSVAPSFFPNCAAL